MAGDLHDKIQRLSVLLRDKFFLDGGDGITRELFLASSAALKMGASEVGVARRSTPWLVGRVADVVQEQLVESSPPNWVSPCRLGHDLGPRRFDLRDRTSKRAAAQVVDKQ